MLGLSWRYRAGCIRMLVEQTVLVAFALAGLGLTGLAIDWIRYCLDPQNLKPPTWPLGLAPPMNWSPLGVLWLIASLVFLIALIHAGLRYVSAITAARLTQDIVIQLRSDVYDKLQRLSFRFYDANESGSIINRVTGDVQAVRMFVDGILIKAITVLLTLIVYLVYMLSVHVLLTVVCLGTTPLLFVGAYYFSRRVRPAYMENSKLVDRMILTLSENVQGIQVVKGFGREPQQIEAFGDDNRAIRDQKERIFWQISIFQPTMGFLTQLNLFILLGFGGYLVIAGEIRLGEGLFVFANLLQEFATQIGHLTNIASSIQQSFTGARRVFEVLDAPVEIHDAPNAIPLPRATGAVSFEYVSFGYDPANLVIRDVSFTAEPGQRIAIVGATGAGKSSLLSLIPRFYDVSAGRMLVDGIDVRRLRLDDLRRNTGLVFQESFLFSNTIAANVAFGHPEATPAQIEQACRIAAAHEFIVELPEGYDTVIGEHGSNLSGGQRQRLAIARAILLDPPILILDDATAAVDPETEHEIHAAMESAMQGRTTFIIAHRLSTLRRADLVVVLENGRMTQLGTHDDLLRAPGHYREIAEIQIAGVSEGDFEESIS